MNLLHPLVERQQPSNLVTPESFGFNGNQYPLFGWHGSRPDWPDADFRGYIAGIHERNGIVAAAVEARALPLSQMWFEWDVDGERFPVPQLNAPAGATRPAFLKSLEYDASYHGAAYIVDTGTGPRRLRPDHTSVLLGSNESPEWDGTNAQYVTPWDAEVVGLVYHPESHSGPSISGQVTVFAPEQFRIWAPEPDPVNFWRGTAWVNAVMREIVADGQALDHTTAFFDNAATPNLVFIMDPSKTPEQIKEFAAVVNAGHVGNGKAFKNMFLGGGTNVEAVGSSLESLNLKDLTGGFETRIALRARIPGVILGVREGYSGSSLNSGNYGSARRMMADGWFAPTAEALCATLEPIARKPVPHAQLTYDRTRILLLQEDEKDAAEIAQIDASTMRQLIDGGYEPKSVKESVMARDWSKLVHTGNVSVQLQPPGTGQETTS